MISKEIILGIITAASGLANAYLWKEAIAAGEFRDAAFYSLPVIALFAFAVLFALSSAFIRQRLIRSIAAVAALVSGYIFIPYSATVLSAAGLTALGGWYAGEQISNEHAASNYFSVRKILKSGLPIFFSGLSLMLAAFYFSVASAGENQTLLPKALFDAVIPLLEEPLQGILPGFRSEASVDELMLAFAAKQSGADIDISQLPQAVREPLLAEGRKALERQFGVKLAGKEKGADALYQMANAQMAKLAGPYQKYLPLIAAFGFFLAVKTFTLPVYWISLILVAGIVRLLIAAGILKREIATAQIEKITL